MKNNKTIAFVCLVALQQGCSTLDSILPDRKKEYQYSQEIEELEIPPDLTSDSIEQPPEYLAPNSGISTYSELMEEKARLESGEPLPSPEVELVESAGAEGAYLEVSEDFPRAWRVVGRAISNVGVEIFDRNRSIGIYYVLLQPDEVETAAAKQQEEEEYDPLNMDDGLLSDIGFLVGEDEAAVTEREYRVKMVEQNGVTVVRVLNDAGKPQSDGPGLELLQRVKERLQGNEGYRDKPAETEQAQEMPATNGNNGGQQPAGESGQPAKQQKTPAKQPQWDEDDYEVPSGDLRG